MDSQTITMQTIPIQIVRQRSAGLVLLAPKPQSAQSIIKYMKSIVRILFHTSNFTRSRPLVLRSRILPRLPQRIPILTLPLCDSQRAHCSLFPQQHLPYLFALFETSRSCSLVILFYTVHSHLPSRSTLHTMHSIPPFA
jgi:hypothetical protein